MIKYDPYASAGSGVPKEPDEEERKRVELLEQSRGLMELARLQSTGQEVRRTCFKCGGSGHLTRECRNMIKLDGGKRDDAAAGGLDDEEDDDDNKPVLDIAPSTMVAPSLARNDGTRVHHSSHPKHARSRSRSRERHHSHKKHHSRSREHHHSHRTASSGSETGSHGEGRRHQHHHRDGGHRRRHHGDRSKSPEAAHAHGDRA